MMNLTDRVIAGIENIEHCMNHCPLDGTRCQHFPGSLIEDIKALIHSQHDRIKELEQQNVPDTKAEPWISVKKRFPEIGEPFYAACKSLVDDRENWTIEGIYRLNRIGGPWGVIMVDLGKAEVYAWMPKIPPEPPKEE